MILRRDIQEAVLRFTKFPAVGIFGPRQSGKTTLAKNIFKKHAYLNFEHPETLEFVMRDPKAFLQKYENAHGIILDEFQHFPQILSYLQIEIDEKKRPGYFILTGPVFAKSFVGLASQNFLMNQAITQSLAGRIGILTLLPLSINEFAHNELLHDDVNAMIVNGCYPRIYTEKFSPDELYPSYIQTYVQRDVRLLTNVENLLTFKKFMQLCAGRIGQLLNVSDIATNCGIAQRTAQHWLSILEASYIIFLLPPYHGNFNKRVTKTPKLYFYDTGLASSLLGIKTAEHLALSPFRGHLFECFIIADLFKQCFNMGTNAPLYFWRDRNGLIEVDCLVDRGGNLTPIEIKSGQTIIGDFFQSLSKWTELAHANPVNSYVIYGGTDVQQRNVGTIVGWKHAGNILTKLLQ